MYAKKLMVTIAISGSIMLSGCASLFNDTKQRVTIKSMPDGADIVVDGRTLTTPTTIELKGKEGYYVTATKKGYNQTTSKIDSDIRFGSAIVGNVFSWGLLGIGVDFLATGTAYKLQPELLVVLQKTDKGE
jgi:hypothetical protein